MANALSTHPQGSFRIAKQVLMDGSKVYDILFTDADGQIMRIAAPVNVAEATILCTALNEALGI